MRRTGRMFDNGDDSVEEEDDGNAQACGLRSMIKVRNDEDDDEEEVVVVIANRTKRRNGKMV
jgi:hypothetical protein